MAIKFLNHLDLTQNEIQNTALHNTESSDITTPVDGQIIFDNGSGVNKLKYYDGSSWVSVGSSYSHPTHTALTINLDATGASVISTIDFTSDGLGHVTSATATTRTLTLSDLGYTGDSDANNYVHPNHTGHVTSTGDGATVLTVSAITGQTALTSGLAGTDEFVISDDGVIKRMDVGVLQTYMQNNLTFTTDTNTDTLQSIAADSSNADRYITSVANATGAQTGLSHSTLTYNPSTETLNVTNLVVSGTSTTINTEEINLADNIIILNSNYAGSSPTENAGIEVERGTVDSNVSLVWNENSNRWTFTNDGTTYYNIPISSEYDNFNFSVSDGTNTQEVGDGGTLTFAQGGGLTVAVSGNDTVTYTHADTSSQSSVNNSGRTYIQDITLDTFGHITGITSATETVTNTDTQLATKEADIDVSNTTFTANKRATINHALNSENVIVQMYDKTTGAVVHADVEHTSDGSTISKNHVRIEFGVVPANDIRVIMIDAKDAAASVTPSYS
ncbi:MAG: hypothetical protein DRP42_02635 [Tenericutes bacterium]|nr:MAG: hypothetical protein DRP42_02635 [Mycoplasmatota bacterium]